MFRFRLDRQLLGEHELKAARGGRAVRVRPYAHCEPESGHLQRRRPDCNLSTKPPPTPLGCPNPAPREEQVRAEQPEPDAARRVQPARELEDPRGVAGAARVEGRGAAGAVGLAGDQGGAVAGPVGRPEVASGSGLGKCVRVHCRSALWTTVDR